MMDQPSVRRREAPPVLFSGTRIGRRSVLWSRRWPPCGEVSRASLHSRGPRASSAPTGLTAAIWPRAPRAQRVARLQRFDMFCSPWAAGWDVHSVCTRPSASVVLVIANLRRRLGSEISGTAHRRSSAGPANFRESHGALSTSLTSAGLRVRVRRRWSRTPARWFLSTQAAGYNRSCAHSATSTSASSCSDPRADARHRATATSPRRPPINSRLAKHPRRWLVIFRPRHLSDLEVPDSFTAALKQFLA